jgi:hypothetical protein
MHGGALHGRLHRPRGDDLAQAITTIPHGHRPVFADDADFRDRVHDAASQPLQVRRESHHAVRFVSPQLSLHQAVGHEARVFIRDARIFQCRGCETCQIPGR